MQCTYAYPEELCGAEIPSTAKFCVACGEAVKHEEVASALCPECEIIVQQTDKFCSQCGIGIEPKSFPLKQNCCKGKRKAKVCGANLTLDDTFCPKCGTATAVSKELENIRTENTEKTKKIEPIVKDDSREAESQERFGTSTRQDIDDKRRNIHADKTQKSNTLSAKLFREYLTSKNHEADFESFTTQRLDEALSHFYLDVRKIDGSMYKTSSLESIRHGLNRHLKAPPNNKVFDIIKDAAFRYANMSFDAARAELKQAGKGNVQHYPIIQESDREKLYKSVYFSTHTPTGLFNKVQYDIRLYFCRRGAENMHTMTKSTFALKTDPDTGMRYIEKILDELTKNHRGNDKETTSGVMPEATGSMYCPVDSFIKYTDKLHPDCDRLWQRPRDCFVDDDNEIWYYNAPVGEKKLKTFMSDLSLSCKLSQKYTNHSIRATGASILSKNKFNDAQIMSVTGHKSVQSLSVYQRVDTQEKLGMGQTLGVAMGAVPARIEAFPAPPIRSALPAPPIRSALPAPPIRSALLAPPARLALTENGSMAPALIEADTPQTLHSDFEGFDLNAILGDFDYNESSINVSNTRQAAGPQLFHKCKVTIIQNLTLNK